MQPPGADRCPTGSDPQRCRYSRTARASPHPCRTVNRQIRLFPPALPNWLLLSDKRRSRFCASWPHLVGAAVTPLSPFVSNTAPICRKSGEIQSPHRSLLQSRPAGQHPVCSLPSTTTGGDPHRPIPPATEIRTAPQMPPLSPQPLDRPPNPRHIPAHDRPEQNPQFLHRGAYRPR